ncbi:MAG: TlpA disulfide reductase family protein [Gammaproteobacteria bacterium]|jgi:peroxiredoxin
MKTKDIFISVFAIALIGGLLALWLAPSGMRKAPDIHFTTLDGRQMSLADLRGRPVLVNFWATTCPGCIKEMPELVKLYRKFSPQGLEIIGVSMSYDPPDQVRAMQALRKLPYLLTMDTDDKIAKAFGEIRLTPTSFLIAPDGTIVYQKLGELNFKHIEQTISGLLPAKAKESA